MDSLDVLPDTHLQVSCEPLSRQVGSVVHGFGRQLGRGAVFRNGARQERSLVSPSIDHECGTRSDWPGIDQKSAFVQLGAVAVGSRAKSALRRWKQFDVGWAEAWPAETPIRIGEVVAIVAEITGVWWLNACKIVYVVEESGPISRFGLAYGTLPDHAERGEERFLVEWDHADNSVWYDILAFSRPNHFLAWLGYPFVRRTQKRFRQESAAAMLKAVRSDAEVRAG
jgi:uncharacterized protein (UPF0548 family)